MIRKAKIEDAEHVCRVLRTSIIELCALDHKGNQDELDNWLANKTIQNCAEWIANSKLNFFVAEQNGKIVGVSSISNTGYLGLCYVLPSVLGKGVGRQLLEAAEASIFEKGVDVVSLESTITARGFYEHCGYMKVSDTDEGLEYEKRKKHDKRVLSDNQAATRFVSR